MSQNGLNVRIQLQHQREKRLISPVISKANMTLCKYCIFILIGFGVVFFLVFFSKSYKYKKRDRILAKAVEKQVTINKTPVVSRVISESVLFSIGEKKLI